MQTPIFIDDIKKVRQAPVEFPELYGPPKLITIEKDSSILNLAFEKVPQEDQYYLLSPRDLYFATLSFTASKFEKLDFTLSSYLNGLLELKPFYERGAHELGLNQKAFLKVLAQNTIKVHKEACLGRMED